MVGFLVQESYHPMHEDAGGMAITHMASILHLPNNEGNEGVCTVRVFVRMIGCA